MRKCIICPETCVTYVKSKVFPDYFFTVRRHFCITYKVCCQFFIFRLLCNDCTCTADTYGTILLSFFKYRTWRDIPVAFFFRHIVFKSAHIPHCLRERYDIVVKDVLVTSFQIDLSVRRDLCDAVVQPSLLICKHICNRL